MPNGKPGDNPLTDIVIHGLSVYSDKADALIREINSLGGRDKIGDMLFLEYNEYRNPDVPKLERVLTGIRDRLQEQAKDRDETEP